MRSLQKWDVCDYNASTRRVRRETRREKVIESCTGALFFGSLISENRYDR